jgi:DNA-binding MarR family transcriptional regulator
MHPLSFLQKRAHLCAVARGREMFAHVEEMTPARFDLLYLMFQGETELVKLTAALGLARQTVWKMMDRLVQLGLIVKRNAQYPRRRILLAFTKEGERRMCLAMDAAFSRRWPLPKDAPADDDRPRYWRRPELSDDPALRTSQRARPPVSPGRCKSGVRHPSDRNDNDTQNPNHATRYDATGLLYETSRGPRQRTRSVWCEHGARYTARVLPRASGGKLASRAIRCANGSPAPTDVPIEDRDDHLVDHVASHLVDRDVDRDVDRVADHVEHTLLLARWECCARDTENATPDRRRDGSTRHERRRIRCESGARHESRQGSTHVKRRARGHGESARANALPEQLGREVARIYSTFAWRRTRGGRRGKRDRYLLYLDDLISQTQDIACALGNRAWPIYQLRFTEELDH